MGLSSGDKIGIDVNTDSSCLMVNIFYLMKEYVSSLLQGTWNLIRLPAWFPAKNINRDYSQVEGNHVHSQ